jgi:hypothetical protein
MDKKWCMCTELKGVARDGFSTCSVCGGKDAYGGSKERGVKYRKVLASESRVDSASNNRAMVPCNQYMKQSSVVSMCPIGHFKCGVSPCMVTQHQ